MLSTTNSVADVKTRLAKTYSDFDLADEAAYTAAVTIALEDVQLLWMYPAMGSGTYATVAAKDKVSLSEKETLLYWAEVYFSCFEFMKQRETSVSSSSSGSSSERLKVEGYEYESESGSSEGVSSMDTAIKSYYDKGVHYMALAGWNIHQLQRGGGAFGTTLDSDLVYTDIV